jgi:Protein of unknown function (DUF1553)/Protein of unknown function (DUF1549)/Planctomycete cytochrome C
LHSDEPRFLFGINLNGPSVFIDGHQWEGHSSTKYYCSDKAFENHSIPLVPPTDDQRALMIRSSRWGGNRLVIDELDSGVYSVFLYVWEDNNPETYSISINSRAVLRNYNSGPAGHWERLGPWPVKVTSGRIVVTSQGGAANFSGIEVWQGKHDGNVEKEIDDDQLAFFEKRIRPLLVNKCYACHASDAKEIEGELLVDSSAALRTGGSSGPAIVPGKPDDSLLIRAVRYADDNLKMPPDEKLSAMEIQDLEQWVRDGAPDPRKKSTGYQRKQMDLAAARDFWSLRPIQAPSLPLVQRKDWPTSAIDYFTLAAMEKHGLSPSEQAHRRTLIRRATFDLIGLPPTPAEVAAFVSDQSPDAYTRVVDRLLASVQYGQRWGRHWLDVVRYADTAGDNSDFPIPQMHLYRDWVIASFNRDMAYDQFVRAQLAGDLLPYDHMEARREQIIATGYIANSRRFGSRVDDYPQHLTIEDTLDNFGRAFLGMTINCARCHDHKFDPITAQDYYALYGIFQSTRYPWPGIELEQRQRDLVPLASDEEVNQFEKEKASRQKVLDHEVAELEKAAKQASPEAKKDVEERLKKARQSARVNSQRTPPYEVIYGVAEGLDRDDAAIQLKGDPAKLGEVVRRRFPIVLGGQELAEDEPSSGRLQLAGWLFDRNNPLTARVIVNRIWQKHFGKGLVPTPNDFGRQGKPPTHPELIDYLAIQFINDGWSIKNLHRRIMLSKTYQMSSERDATATDADPNNDWLASYPRRRLDAEAIRDSMLSLGELLDNSTPGPHPFPPQEEWKFTQHNPFKAEYVTNQRSVYLMTQRIQRHSYLAIFDGADPSTSTAVRSSTTTPLQALYFLNDEKVHQIAVGFANRLMRGNATERECIDQAFQLAFSRSPTENEFHQGLRFLESMRTEMRAEGTSANEIDRAAWQAFARVLMRLNEFVYLD